MHTHYKAICDKHKEAIDVLVNKNYSIVFHFQEDFRHLISAFLDKHYSCDLRITHSDEALDFIFTNNYLLVDKMSDELQKMYIALVKYLSVEEVEKMLKPNVLEIKEYKNGLKIRELKDLIKFLPEKSDTGESFEVWITTGENLSSPVSEISPLNLRKDGSNILLT